MHCWCDALDDLVQVILRNCVKERGELTRDVTSLKAWVWIEARGRIDGLRINEASYRGLRWWNSKQRGDVHVEWLRLA